MRSDTMSRFDRATFRRALVGCACAIALLHGATSNAHGVDVDQSRNATGSSLPTDAVRDDGDPDSANGSLDATDQHLLIDVAPTPTEEAELLRRVEQEGLGVNPRDTFAPQVAGNPEQTGRWEPLQDWPVIGVFSSLLPDGRVLTFDSVGDAPTESFPTHDFTRASLWDPVTGSHVRIDIDTGYNAFCSGFASLPDGRLFIAGGNADAALHGIEETHLFNPLSDTWSLGQRMDYARWYPAVTPLPNGEMLITGGGFATSEVRETDGAIRQLTSASSSVWDNRNYPWLQTAPDGRVAFLGPDPQLGYVDTNGSGSFQTTIQREGSQRNYGSYAMFDIGKVLVAGGGFQSSVTDQRTTRIIDLETDTVSTSSSMNNRRRQHNLTVLADGSVLATGGFASNQGLVDLSNPVYEAELWDPTTGLWQPLADEDRARQYHSTALLLPDGRVLSAGGGICGDCQQVGYIQKNGQVFTPPYLFRKDGSGDLADRPVIQSAPDAIEHDTDFQIDTVQATSISKVAMLRIGSVTHSQNMEQRYIPLDFLVGSGSLSVRSPRNANIAPPGYYLLFVIDADGVPSMAHTINVSNSLSPPEPATNATNSAIFGTATQSSTSNGADASRAIDGNPDGVAANGSVSQTTSGNQPWWELDLGEVQDVRQIVVRPRTDCCSGQLSNFHVIVSAVPFESSGLSNSLAQSSVSDYYVPDSASETRLDIDRPARYVRVQLAGQDALELAEVEVLIDGTGQGVTCGSPNVDPAVDGGVHVWKECDGGPWTLLLTGQPDSGTIKASGKITSELGALSITPRSVESSDTLTTSDPSRSDFALSTSSPWTDHFEFSTVADDALCLGLDTLRGEQQIYFGRYRVPAGLGPVDPETLQSCEFSGFDCSAPTYDQTSEKALVSWVDCAGVVHLVAMGGQDFARFSGHVYASTQFTASETRSFESSDTLTEVSDADFYFNMGTGGGGSDGFLLTSTPDTELCVEITGQSAGTTLLAGASRTQVSSPFNPRTLATCVPPTGGDECGAPQIDTASDSALFVWKNCDGSWSVVLTGTSATGSVVKIIGSITSDAGFASITLGGVESTDSVSVELSNPLTFDLRTVNPWKDDFDFTVPDGSNLCVTISVATDGLDLLAGPDRTPVGVSFDPATYGTCQ